MSLAVRGQFIRSNSRAYSTTSIYMLSVTDFYPTGTISEVRVDAGENLEKLDVGRSTNSARVHAKTTQVDFEVGLPPPAVSPRDLLINIVKETAKKKSFEKIKKSETCSYLLLIESDENAIHCEIACDCVKHGNMVLGHGQEAHSYSQADICSVPFNDHDDTHAHTHTHTWYSSVEPLGLRPSGAVIVRGALRPMVWGGNNISNRLWSP